MGILIRRKGGKFWFVLALFFGMLFLPSGAVFSTKFFNPVNVAEGGTTSGINAQLAALGRYGDSAATRTPGRLPGRAPKMLMATLFAHELSATVPFSREWAATWDLGSFNDLGQSIATDSVGNVYVAAFDQEAYYLRKYSSAGIQIWSRTAVTTEHVFLQGFINAYVVVDPSDCPILAGTMNANDGTSLDYFVVKFDPAGTQLWLRRFDANNDHDSLEAVAVDEAGNIYAHGEGNGSGPRNVYTVKYDRDGTRLWVASYTPRDDLGCGVAVHSDGSVYALVSTTDYGTDDDIILIKYSASGEQLWLRRYNGGGESGWTDDWPSRLKLDAAGNAYLVGYSEPSDGGGYGLVTQKYMADGTLAWMRRYDAAYPSSGDFGYQPAGLAIDDRGQVYVSGQIENYSVGSTGADAVTIEYAADGTQLWARAYNGSSNGPDVPRDLVLTPDGSIFVLVRSRIGTYSSDDRLLLIQYDSDGTLLSTHVDSGSIDGYMLARWGASIYIVGTSTVAASTGYDVTVRKYSPVQMTVTVTSPNGGESWTVGSSHNITWTSTGTIANVNIDYSTNSGGSWTSVVAGTGNDGTHAWTVPNTPSSQCLVRISDAANATIKDTSNATFSIVPVPTLTVAAPNGSENWTVGTFHNITWSSTGTIANVKIEYSINKGASWSNVIAATPNDGIHAWIVPDTPSSQCLVRISDATNTAVKDISNAVFTIMMNLELSAERHEVKAFSILRYYGQIQFTVDNAGIAIAQYRIMRRKGTVDFALLKAVAPSELKNNLFQMQDKYLEKDIPYTYRVEAYDTAQQLVGVSVEKTI